MLKLFFGFDLLLTYLVPLYLALQCSSVWLAVVVFVVSFAGMKLYQLVVSTLVADLWFGSTEEFNRLAWEAENELWGWSDPYEE
jgi:hypothetical protein